MSDPTNLIYNGDFSQGTDSWTGGSNLSVSNGVLTVTGDLHQDIYIPTATNRRYRLTYDLKVTNNDGSHYFYIALWPYDNMRTFIPVDCVNTYANTKTTLASALSSGATSVSLTSGANWQASKRLGICNKLGWDYNRAVSTLGYSTVSGNTITLSSAYTGSTIAAGTKVISCAYGGTYCYPHYLNNSQLPTDWTTYSVEFNGGNNVRYSCQYFRFCTLGYSHTYQMRNIRLECISDSQFCPKETPNVNITKQSEVFANRFDEVGMKIRYVRDTIHGSTANTGNHWCEVKIINDIGENLAWGHTFNNGSTTSTNGACHDGIVNSSYTSGTNSNATITFDLGYVENIEKLQIWHYYPDGRTYYNNVTEVSVDGTNWIPVYQGEKPETSAGNTIYLYPHQAQIYKAGIIKAKDFYEI